MFSSNKLTNTDKVIGFFTDINRIEGLSLNIKHYKNKNRFRKSSELLRSTDEVIRKLMKQSSQQSINESNKDKIYDQLSTILKGLEKLDAHADELAKEDPHRIWKVVVNFFFPGFINSKKVKQDIKNLSMQIPSDALPYLKNPLFQKQASDVLNKLFNLPGTDKEKMTKINEIIQPFQKEFLSTNFGADELLPFLEALLRTDFSRSKNIYHTVLKDIKSFDYEGDISANTFYLQIAGHHLFNESS